jgi:hypothetical protein
VPWIFAIFCRSSVVADRQFVSRFRSEIRRESAESAAVSRRAVGYLPEKATPASRSFVGAAPPFAHESSGGKCVGRPGVGEFREWTSRARAGAIGTRGRALRAPAHKLPHQSRSKSPGGAPKRPSVLRGIPLCAPTSERSVACPHRIGSEGGPFQPALRASERMTAGSADSHSSVIIHKWSPARLTALLVMSTSQGRDRDNRAFRNLSNCQMLGGEKVRHLQSFDDDRQTPTG